MEIDTDKETKHSSDSDMDSSDDGDVDRSFPLSFTFLKSITDVRIDSDEWEEADLEEIVEKTKKNEAELKKKLKEQEESLTKGNKVSKQKVGPTLSDTSSTKKVESVPKSSNKVEGGKPSQKAELKANSKVEVKAKAKVVEAKEPTAKAKVAATKEAAKVTPSKLISSEKTKVRKEAEVTPKPKEDKKAVPPKKEAEEKPSKAKEEKRPAQPSQPQTKRKRVEVDSEEEEAEIGDLEQVRIPCFKLNCLPLLLPSLIVGTLGANDGTEATEDSCEYARG